MTLIRSRDNARVKRWTKLVRDAAFRRSEGKLVVEGPHLVAEALAAGLRPLALIVSEAGLQRAEIRQLAKNREPVVLADRVFAAIADAGTPPGIAAELDLPHGAAGDAARDSVFLEGIQDPSNVGALLRSAAAFGVGEVVLDRACADPWAPKALRAAQGAHFRLALTQVNALEQPLDAFAGTRVCTVVEHGIALREAPLDGRLGWIFGGEGRGVSEALARRAALKVTIPMVPGTQSINVAAAAAICLYEAFSRRGGGCAARAGSS